MQESTLDMYIKSLGHVLCVCASWLAPIVRMSVSCAGVGPISVMSAIDVLKFQTS